MNKKLYPLSMLVLSILVIAFQLASYQPASAIHSEVAILALPSRSTGETQSLTVVYADPEVTSQMIDVLSQGTQVQILGFSESGAWIALARPYPPFLVGWTPASEVKHDLTVASTRSLVLTHQQPSSSSRVASVLSPGASVQVVGRSVDNSWVAISTPGFPRASITWVATSELQLPGVIASTMYLSMFYLIPDDSSRVTFVSAPTHNVALIGRNTAGTWFAATDMRTDQFIGWVQGSHLDGATNRSLLPILSDR